MTSTTSPASTSERYDQSGDYLEKTGGTWHLEDAPFKAAQVLKMIERHKLSPKLVAEIGCGAGGILSELHSKLPASVNFVGYEIAPQAHEMSRRFASERLRFVLGDAFEDDVRADVVLVMDVIEHVEDAFGFLRKTRAKGEYKIYHIPLDISVSATLRDSYLNAWRSVGHIHVFSRVLALETLRATGHEIVDHFYTPGALNIGRGLRAQIGNIPRRLLPQSLASRLFGGFSLLVLAR
jgi:SAM-dependent methyltransferase